VDLRQYIPSVYEDLLAEVLGHAQRIVESSSILSTTKNAKQIHLLSALSFLQHDIPVDVLSGCHGSNLVV
jgi:hypothetical protein